MRILDSARKVLTIKAIFSAFRNAKFPIVRISFKDIQTFKELLKEILKS